MGREGIVAQEDASPSLYIERENSMYVGDSLNGENQPLVTDEPVEFEK